MKVEAALKIAVHVPVAQMQPEPLISQITFHFNRKKFIAELRNFSFSVRDLLYNWIVARVTQFLRRWETTVDNVIRSFICRSQQKLRTHRQKHSSQCWSLHFRFRSDAARFCPTFSRFIVHWTFDNEICWISQLSFLRMMNSIQVSQRL